MLCLKRKIPLNLFDQLIILVSRLLGNSKLVAYLIFLRRHLALEQQDANRLLKWNIELIRNCAYIRFQVNLKMP